jgi:hypothetical protein
LNPTRFQGLADAYGGDIARWPEAERSAALAFAEADPTAEGILAEATALDRMLAASPTPAPSLALREAIVASAPRPRGRAIGRRWVGLGASLAAASVAGVLAGAAAAPIAASHLRMRTADTANEAARWLSEPADVTEG